MAPASSHTKTALRIVRTSRISWCMVGWFRSSRRKVCPVRPTGTPSAPRISTAKVISPSPPSWIRKASTISPNSVSPAPVSNTTRPVTVTAEVAVKMASDHVSGTLRAIGSISATAPSKMNSA